MFCKCGKITREFFGRFCFCFSLVFYILRVLPIKQLFYLRWLGNMRWLHSQLISNARALVEFCPRMASRMAGNFALRPFAFR